ncbi:MAG: ABC transporter ATP-binding protein [Clostridia bacterium]|nr:ABC transporter ATP-binding protein [Clostridia bacterium]
MSKNNKDKKMPQTTATTMDAINQQTDNTNTGATEQMDTTAKQPYYNSAGLKDKEHQKGGIYDMPKLKLLGRMVAHAKPIAKWLLLSAVIMIMSVGISIFAPIVMKNITNELFAIAEGDYLWKEIVSNSIILAVLYLLSSVISAGNMLIMNNVVSRFYTCGIRIEISDKIQRLPVAFVDNTPKGEIMSRMTGDVSRMGNTIHNIIHLLIQGAFQLIGITVMMFTQVNWLMALVVVCIIPVSLVLSALLVNKSEAEFSKERRVWGKLHAFIEENYTGFETIKAFNLEESQNKRQADSCDEMRVYSEKGWYISGRVQPVIQFANSVVFLIICVLGGYLTITKQTTIGDMVAIIAYAKLFSAPLESIANGMSMIQKALASARRVYELLDKEEMDVSPNRDVEMTGCGDVEFKDVCFTYNPNIKLIQNLNLNVKRGQKVAIVGPTGGGKTTIVNLLMRFYDCDSGQILIDGIDCRKVPREKVRSQFSMVLQDTWLYSGTIYDNIAYAKPTATREEVIDAAKKAHIDTFIESLPQGYDTVINEESTNISSGQKQLLTIARAYLSDKDMLILDEATSNVDTRTELLIQQTMDELTKQKTSFVIAHRLSTIVDADIILVVNNGQIVETGTHKQLMEQNGFYCQIYNSQYDLLV